LKTRKLFILRNAKNAKNAKSPPFGYAVRGELLLALGNLSLPFPFQGMKINKLRKAFSNMRPWYLSTTSQPLKAL
jgi:hypothetical protein